MLVLLLAATLAAPAPIQMKVGETIFIDVFRPSMMTYGGGYFRSENLRVADVGGQFPVAGKRSRARVIALRPGRTEVFLTYVCGMGVCNTPVATVIVSPAAAPPAPSPPTRRRSARH